MPFFLFVIEVWLVYNVVLVSVVQQSDSTIDINVFERDFVHYRNSKGVYGGSLWLRHAGALL